MAAVFCKGGVSDLYCFRNICPVCIDQQDLPVYIYSRHAVFSRLYLVIYGHPVLGEYADVHPFYRTGQSPSIRYKNMMNKKSTVILKTLFYYLLIIGFSFLILRINWMLTVPKIVEAFLSLAVVLCVVSFKAIRDYLAEVPAVHLRIFLVFFFLLSSAHFIEKEKTTFPFLTWGMYSGRYVKPHMDFYDYEGIEANGRRVRIIPESVFPVMTHSRLNKKLEYLLKLSASPATGNALQEGDDPGSIFKKISRSVFYFFEGKPIPAEKSAEMLDALLIAVGHQYNEAHENSPVVAVEMVLNQRDLIFTSTAELRKETVRRVNMRGD